MAWKEVSVKGKKGDVAGWQSSDGRMELPNQVQQSDSITVDGKQLKVDSWVVDERDDRIFIQLADARTKKKEQSNDESDEGRNTG